MNEDDNVNSKLLQIPSKRRSSVVQHLKTKKHIRNKLNEGLENKTDSDNEDDVTPPSPVRQSATTQASTSQANTDQACTTQASTKVCTAQASTTEASATEASTAQASTTRKTTIHHLSTSQPFTSHCASTSQASTTTSRASTTRASTNQACITQASSSLASTSQSSEWHFSNSKTGFNRDLCDFLLSCDIPMHKLSMPKFVTFLKTYTGMTPPHPSTLRKYYVNTIYEQTMNKLRNKCKDKKMDFIR